MTRMQDSPTGSLGASRCSTGAWMVAMTHMGCAEWREDSGGEKSAVEFGFVCPHSEDDVEVGHAELAFAGFGDGDLSGGFGGVSVDSGGDGGESDACQLELAGGVEAGAVSGGERGGVGGGAGAPEGADGGHRG